MARSKLNSSDGEGFLRAFTDAWQDTEIEQACRIHFEVSGTARKGVLQLRMWATELDWLGDERGVGAYTCLYPTAQVGTLEAALYQAVVRLERIVSEQRRWPGGKA